MQSLTKDKKNWYTLIVLASELYRTFPGETVEDDDDSDGIVEAVFLI